MFPLSPRAAWHGVLTGVALLPSLLRESPGCAGKLWKKGEGEGQKGGECTAGLSRGGKAAVRAVLAPRVKIPGTLCTLEASAAAAKKAHHKGINHGVWSTPEEHPAQGARGKGADSSPSDRQR